MGIFTRDFLELWGPRGIAYAKAAPAERVEILTSAIEDIVDAHGIDDCEEDCPVVKAAHLIGRTNPTRRGSR
jgi:hypothetical protein